MNIFIRRLPESTTYRELVNFVMGGLKPQPHKLQFRSSGQITRCEICRIHDKDSGLTEFHGMVRVEPSSAALRVINRLNGSSLKSKNMEVRKFFHRSDHRDRRRNESGPPPAKILEQRKRDRRRRHLNFESFHSGAASLGTGQPMAAAF